MSVLLYSICKQPCTTEVSGINHQPVESLEYSGLWVYFSELNREALQIHEVNTEPHPALLFQRVLSSIHGLGASLPMQFGLLLESVGDVQKLVLSNVTEIRKELNRVGSAYEYSCQFKRRSSATRDTPSALANTDTPGARYLLKKYQVSQQSTQLGRETDQLISTVQDFASESLIEVKQSHKEGTLKLHLLLTGEKFDKRGLIATLDKGFPEYESYIFGPYPPSHFVKLKLRGEK